jgi:hypothetical protein
MRTEIEFIGRVFPQGLGYEKRASTIRPSERSLDRSRTRHFQEREQSAPRLLNLLHRFEADTGFAPCADHRAVRQLAARALLTPEPVTTASATK